MQRHLLLPLFLSVQLAAPFAHAEGRALTDDTGRSVVVPDSPERIVVTHDPLLGVPILDIGGRIVGSYGRTDDGGSLAAVDFIDTVLGEDAVPLRPKGVGPSGQMDFEKLRALDPDLIIGSEYNAGIVEQLAQIAPTYLQNTGTGRVRGFEVEQSLAGVLGLEDALAARFSAYQEALAGTRDALPGSPEGKSYLVVIAHDDLRLVGETSGVIQALEDLGYARAEVEGLGEGNGLGSNFAVPLSPELFMRLNPDVLVLMNSYTGSERDEASTRAKLDRIAPGWARFLRPEKEARTIYIDSAKVSTPSIASAEHALAAVRNWAAD
ncbi:ABC transporter substrate-binding protein [Alloyangia pacifica]|uniref:Iron complex transport system substrate-binding protein n=1 Tax=Alloyangia pacifica TaxID=311180 RepID=A0A1I6SXR3_9RHOB|nr:ABC transporter substrate-binding protein [Alloyangia pacifica]SDG90888.1 iron complex transport system substrate-binding protein [Alloyangia pacifica]SFS81755.1 iron complex transport system substrate-binding protein [Alloyangia pacifica]